MFNDIEELSREIDMFKANIKENVDLMKKLEELNSDAKISRTELNENYNSFLEKFEETIKKNEIQNNEMIDKNIESLEKHQEEINKKNKKIVNALENRNIKIEEKIERISVKVDKVEKNTKIIYIALGISIALNLICIFIS